MKTGHIGISKKILPIAFQLRFLVFWVKMVSELCVTFELTGRYSLHFLQPYQLKD